MKPILLRFNVCSVDDNEVLHRCSRIRMCATHWHDRLYGTYQETFAWQLRGAGVDESQMALCHARRKAPLPPAVILSR